MFSAFSVSKKQAIIVAIFCFFLLEILKKKTFYSD